MRFGKTIILILTFISLAQPVFAQLGSNFPQFPYQTWYSPEALAKFLGLKAEWLGIPEVIYYVIVPYIVAVTVTYGILTELRIFRTAYRLNRINIILSAAMAFLLLPSGILTMIVSYLYLAGTFFGLIAFGFLFIVGIFLWARHRTYSMYYEDFPISEFKKKANETAQKATGEREKSNAAIDDQAKKVKNELVKTAKELKQREEELSKLNQVQGVLNEKLALASKSRNPNDINKVHGEVMQNQQLIDKVMRRQNELTAERVALTQAQDKLRAQRI
jgi:hypothetical protein